MPFPRGTATGAGTNNTPLTFMQLAVSVLSRNGGRPVNEDACGWWTGRGVTVCVVSDGAGGHGGGDIASKLVVSRVLACFRAEPSCDAVTIQRALEEANAALVAAQREDAAHADMRATAVVLVIDGERQVALWGNLGDSRLYAFRDALPIARTRDHSVVQRMVEAGYLRTEDLRSSPQRNQLFAALGRPGQFEPYIEPAPHRIQVGDAFLLCTDGCWEHVDDAEFAEVLSGAGSPEDWLGELERLVTARGKSDLDNYSAIALWCTPPATRAGSS